jgi:hypothetical protein
LKKHVDDMGIYSHLWWETKTIQKTIDMDGWKEEVGERKSEEEWTWMDGWRKWERQRVKRNGHGWMDGGSGK